MADNTAQDKELPLAGTILCCTSIVSEQRAELAAIASQMGAVHKFDLTSDVTHMVVGETGTPKYKYVAKQRNDVVVVKPEWVNAVRESWMEGGDTDILALEEKYRFPVFGGLSICVTGFDDQEFRKHLKQTINANGGEFRMDLTKSVTHLIARIPQGQKYQFAREWGVKIVSVKWFNDSLERGMILEEDLYDPRKPDDEQGVGAWNRSLAATTGKRSKPAEPTLRRPRKLRRTASTKLSGQAEGLWTDIVGRNSESVGPSENERDRGTSGFEDPSAPEQPVQAPKSFASETTAAETRDPITQEAAQDVSQVGPDRTTNAGIFSGCRFFALGFSTKKITVLQNHLLSNGAEMSPSLDELSPLSNLGPIKDLYIVIPYDMPRSKLPSTDNLGFDPDFVTDMWIERCLYNRKIVPPEAHITSTPFPKFPIPAFQGLTICSTGFTNIDLLHVSKLVKLIGATYDEYLTSKASVLVCNTSNPSIEKLRHTYEWKIPTVMADWLWISVQTGEKKPFEPYLIPNRQSSSRSGSIPLAKRQEGPVGRQESLTRENLGAKTPTLENGSDGLPKTDTPHLSPRDAARTDNPTVNNSPPTKNSARNNVNEAYNDDSTTPSAKPCAEPITDSEDTRSNSALKPLPSPARSLSETKGTENKAGSETPQPPQKESTSGPASGPLGAAITELLKQKRRGSKPPSENAVVGADGRRTSKRRPLLGRANSLASGRAVTTIGPGRHSSGISRAGSIDSLNDDGTGSVIGSVVDESDNQSNPGKSNGQSFCSVLTTNSNMDNNGVNMYHHPHHTTTERYYDHHGTGFDDEGEHPHMTQLGYEDPDAAAMREKITKQSESSAKGSTSGKNASSTTKGQKKDGDLVLGEVKDLESLGGGGWGAGRRTRRSGRGGGALEGGL